MAYRLRPSAPPPTVEAFRYGHKPEPEWFHKALEDKALTQLEGCVQLPAIMSYALPRIAQPGDWIILSSIPIKESGLDYCCATYSNLQFIAAYEVVDTNPDETYEKQLRTSLDTLRL